jgi:sialic acid synthase SpsE
MNKNIFESIFDKRRNPKTLIVAEAGVNHLGSLERAKELIVKAAESGVDCVKFQTYRASSLVTKKAPKFWNWEGDQQRKTQWEAYDALDKFDWSYYPELIKTCEEHGVEFLSTPFDFEAVDYLDSIGMKAFKVASSDLTYLPFLTHIAKKKKPILLSTGAATLGEIEEAVETIKKAKNKKIILLHCTLKYPTADEDANLNLIRTLRQTFPNLEVGLSDHTFGVLTPPLAVMMGARVIEKHYTVDKGLPDSADHWLSVDPPELKQLVENVRRAEKILGSSVKRVFDCEKETYKYDKRSIVANVDIERGERFTKENLTCKRPGTGIPPKFLSVLYGKVARRGIKADTTLKWKMI